MSSAGRRWPRAAVFAVAAVAALAPLLTVARIPTPFADAELYASIALARATYGVGIPTLIWSSPAAVDHIPFYGPVFFDLCALSFKLFGVGLVSVRMVSVLGALIYVAATIALARPSTRPRGDALIAAAIVLTTPEVNFAATAGTMHLLAVGFEVAAMATFANGLGRARADVLHGIAAGVCLLLGALTTPRTYAFVFAFACAAAIFGIFGSTRRAVRWRTAAALIVCGTGMTAWAVRSHGSVTAWIHYMTFVFTHEDTDVAVLPAAVRVLDFHWSVLLTPAAAIALGLLAASSLRRVRAGQSGVSPGIEPALLLTWGALNFVVCAVVFNYTFSVIEYLALPLLSVVVAWPWEATSIPRRAIAAAMTALLCLECGYVGYRSACLAVTWDAHDPARLDSFIARAAPRGSIVVGPPSPFLFPVERSGSRYRTVGGQSWADWARWVPIVEPGATAFARTFAQPVPRDRFFIWRTDDVIPDAYRCAAGAAVARYEAPPPDERWPRWIVRGAAAYGGYPSATLYRLPPGCPSGYDPTRPRS